MTLIRHCETWDEAMLVKPKGFRLFVVRCRQHHSWNVWQLNRRIKMCSQCGFSLRHRACGPTHALLWHEQKGEL